MPQDPRKAPEAPEPAGESTAVVPALKITKRNLAKFQEKIFLENVEPMLTESFTAIRKGIREGNSKMIQIALEIAGLINSSKTPTFINQNIVKAESRSDATAAAESSASIANGFESLARKLDARDSAARNGNIYDVTIAD